MKKKDIEELFQRFKELNVLIVGDAMIDAYMWGEINRMSPEASVPIVEIEKYEHRLGGAANVALNLKSLGANSFNTIKPLLMATPCSLHLRTLI